jgi:hypothetical protein
MRSLHPPGKTLTQLHAPAARASTAAAAPPPPRIRKRTAPPTLGATVPAYAGALRAWPRAGAPARTVLQLESDTTTRDDASIKVVYPLLEGPRDACVSATHIGEAQQGGVLNLYLERYVPKHGVPSAS